MALKRTARNFFLAPKYLAPCQPLVTVILPILLARLSAMGSIILRSSGALLQTSEALSLTDRWGHCTHLWSAICNHTSEALLPTSEAFLELILGGYARCEECTIPRDDHTMTPPPKHLICQKKCQVHRPSKHHHHHHHPYIKFTNAQCSATPQREAAPATMASRGQLQGSDAGSDSRRAGFPPLRPPPLPPQPAPRPAQLVLPTLHAQTQTYTTTQMSYGLVSCFKAT